MARNSCAYRDCKNSYSNCKTRNVTFHRFPMNNAIEWIIRSGNDGFSELSPGQLREKRLCSDHFDNTMFIGGNSSGRKRKLVSTALPKMIDVDNDNNNDTIMNNSIPSVNLLNVSVAVNEITESATCSELRAGLQLQSNAGSPSYCEDMELATKSQLQSSDDSPRYCPEKLQKLLYGRRERILLKKITNLKSKYMNAQRQIKNMKRRKTTRKPSPDDIIKDASQYLDSEQLILFGMQLKRAVHKKAEWSETEQRFAVSLYYISPKAYSFLRDKMKILLPAITTVRRWVNSLDIFTGLNTEIFTRLRVKVDSMSLSERDAVLMWDEMTIKKHLEYNCKRDIVEGFEDLGELGRTIKCAKKSLVFMIRGLRYSWKLPIAYFHSHTDVKGEDLARLIKDCIEKCFNAGIKIRSMVCDQGTNNQRAVRLLNITEVKPYLITDDKKVYFNWDIPHLFKSVRNQLMTHDILIDGARISWQAIIELYKIEQANKCRAAPKLSERHVKPNSWDKMCVRLATQVFSATVSAALKTGYQSSALRHPSCMATADFLQQMNDLFDCLNAKTARDRNPLRRGISEKYNTVSLVIEKSKEWINSWEYADNTRVLPPCISGLKLSLNSILLLAKDLFNEGQLYLLTSRLNQDSIENLFGTLRRRSGNNVNPSSMQFRHNLQYSIVAGLMSPPKGSNCIDDEDENLIVTKKLPKTALNNNIENPEEIATFSDAGDDSDDEIMDEFITEACEEECNEDYEVEDDEIRIGSPNLEFCAINYVAGYLLSRFFKNYECSLCLSRTTKNGEKLENKNELLIFWKAYDTLDGQYFGHLYVPSDKFYNVIKDSYNVFNNLFPTIMSQVNLKETIERELIGKIEQSHKGFWNNQCQQHRNFIISLFVRTFIFQNLKWINREQASADNKGQKRSYDTKNTSAHLKLKKVMSR